MSTPHDAALAGELSSVAVHHLIAPTADGSHRVLHLFGHREDRADDLAFVRQEVSHQFDVVHHWRPWYRKPLWGKESPVTPLPRVPMTKLSRILHCIALVGFWFAIGVVVNLIVRAQ